MPDQNTTTLLAAMLGGLLSIAGGIAANYYITQATNNTQKKKEVRNILEAIYKCTQVIIQNCSEIYSGWIYTKDVKENYKELDENMEKIEMLVNLYLPPLAKDFEEYQEGILDEILAAEHYNEELNVDKLIQAGDFDLEQKVEATETFRKAVGDLLKKKGYNYF